MSLSCPSPGNASRQHHPAVCRTLNRRRRVVISVVLLLVGLAGPVAAEVWTDSTGQFQIEAEFVGIRGTDLYLKKATGAIIKVPLARLSADSQQLARRRAAAATPAPDAAATDDAPDAAIRALQARIEAGDLRAVWDALPSGHQRDVNDLIRTFGANMDVGVWTAGTGLVQKIVRLLKEKKEFLLSQPALSQGPVNMATIAENWDGLVGVLETIVTSELADLKQLQAIDMGAFFDGTGKKLADRLAALAKAADDKKLALTEFPAMPVEAMPLAGLATAKISTVKRDGDTATLRVENDGKTEEHEFVRVDGKWLPRPMVDEWPDKIRDAKTALTITMPDRLKKNRLQIIMPLQMIQGVVDQLLAAKTQAEFDQVLQQVMQMFAPAGNAPPGAAAPGGP